MTADREHFRKLALELKDLQDHSKTSVAKILERAEGAGFDPAGLRRFVAWKRQDEEKRGQRAAIDHQCRFLAGEVDVPAVLPIGCELARAVNCYRRGLTVRQTADELSISTGKAGKLKQLSQMFLVHANVDMDKTRGVEAASTPPIALAKGIGHNSKRACILPRSDTWKEITSARDAADAEAAAEIERIAAAKKAEQDRRAAEREAERLRNLAIDADTLEFPPALRRTASEDVKARSSGFIAGSTNDSSTGPSPITQEK